MHPLDIVVTKIGRLDTRDWQDIEECIRKFKLRRDQIKRRAGQVEYAGNEEIYASNLESVLAKFFRNKHSATQDRSA